MKHPKSELYFLITLLIGALVLAFFIFKPFLYALILAVVFATIFRPIHKKMIIAAGGHKIFAALLTTLSVLIIVIVPLTFLGIQIFQEATGLYSSLINNGSATDFPRIISDIIRSLNRFLPIPIEFNFDINLYLRQGLSWLIQNLGPLFANIAGVITDIFIFLVALYYLFKDGHKLKVAVVSLSPLQDTHDQTIFNKLTLAINSVIKGSLTIALIQGVLTGIGFTIFGVPNPVLWGSVAAIAALIPAIGTSLIILPAVIYLYFTGQAFLSIGLLVWGMVAVGLIDNVLGPKLVERGIQVHPFLILLSILGGIAFFGPLGLVLGPLVLGSLFALLEIYIAIRKEHGGQ